MKHVSASDISVAIHIMVDVAGAGCVHVATIVVRNRRSLLVVMKMTRTTQLMHRAAGFDIAVAGGVMIKVAARGIVLSSLLIMNC